MVFGAWVGVGLTLACSASVFRREAVDAAVLDGFAIHTHDKAVTVTLYTDQKATYSTESQGRQFTIVLPDAQLSKRQLDEGLPVVIDDKNRFIGRAVPTADGKVKIILPNLPSGEYAVSVQQQHAPSPDSLENAAIDSRAVATASAKANRISRILPRPAVKAPPAKHTGPFIVSNRNIASSAEETPLSIAPQSRPMRLTASNEPDTSGSPVRGTIWNPYVVKHPPSNTDTRRDAEKNPTIHNDSSSWIYSQTPSLPANSAFRPATGNPLSYLQAISSNAFRAAPPRFPILMAPVAPYRPASPSTSKTTISGTGAPSEPVSLPSSVKNKPVQHPPASFAPSPPASRNTNPPEPLASLPAWLWLALSLFFGGIGLFSLIGSLSLLRLVFWRELSGDLLARIRHSIDVRKPSTGESARAGKSSKPPWEIAPHFPSHIPIRGKDGSNPAKTGFADTSFINALDYTEKAPPSISNAIHKTLRSRFASASRHRTPHTTVSTRFGALAQRPLNSSDVALSPR